jgi:hypothetical protein
LQKLSALSEEIHLIRSRIMLVSDFHVEDEEQGRVNFAHIF